MKNGNYLEKIQKVIDAVQKNNTCPIYLMSGDESYFVYECQKQLLNSLKKMHKQAEVTILDYDKASIQNTLKTLSTRSLFNTGQIVLVRDVDWFESRNKNELTRLSNWMENAPDSDFLLVTAQSIDKRLSFVKAVSKLGTCLDFPKIKSYGQYDIKKDMYYPIVKNQLAKYNQTIQSDAWVLMRQLTPDNLWAVVNTADVLSSYVGEVLRIEKHDVEKCILDHSDMPAYLFMEALSEKTPFKLKQIIHKTILEGTHPLALSKMLSNRIRVFLTAYALELHKIYLPPAFYTFRDQVLSRIAEKIEADDVAKQLLASMNPFALYQTLIQLKKITISDLIECMERLAFIDKALKSGTTNTQNLYEMSFIPMCKKSRA